MKIFVVFFILMFATIYESFCQQVKPGKPQTRDEFLRKSRGQKTAAWILLGGGVIGIAAVSPGNASFGTTGTVAVLSGVAILSSIPLFIAAGRNKRKGNALPVSLMFDNIPRNIPVTSQFQSPDLSLRITIGKSRR